MTTQHDDLIVRPLAPLPPQTRTSDGPIFKIFDSENLGKLMRYSLTISLIFALEEPPNYYN